MSVYYACKEYGSSILITYEVINEGELSSKKNWVKPENSAEKSLKMLANADKIVWDYEKASRLRNVFSIAQAIFKGYENKYHSAYSNSYLFRLQNLLERMICTFLGRPTHLKKLAELVTIIEYKIEYKMYSTEASKKIQLKKELKEAKEQLELDCQASDQAFEACEKNLKEQINNEFNAVDAIFDQKNEFAQQKIEHSDRYSRQEHEFKTTLQKEERKRQLDAMKADPKQYLLQNIPSPTAKPRDYDLEWAEGGKSITTEYHQKIRECDDTILELDARIKVHEENRAKLTQELIDKRKENHDYKQSLRKHVKELEEAYYEAKNLSRNLLS